MHAQCHECLLNVSNLYIILFIANHRQFIPPDTASSSLVILLLAVSLSCDLEELDAIRQLGATGAAVKDLASFFLTADTQTTVNISVLETLN